MAQAEQLGYACFAARGSRGPVDVVCFQGRVECDECGHIHRFTHQCWVSVRDIHDGSYGCECGVNPPDLKPLVIQVGTTNKPIASTLDELDQAPRPIGSLCLVARRHRKRLMLPSGKKSKALSVVWSWHSSSGKFATLAEALDARG